MFSDVDKSWSEEPQQPSPLNIGDSIILGCSVQALPPVKVKWFKDDQEIETGKTNSSRKYFIHSDGALEMSEVTKSQFGRYKCKVRNESDKKWKTSKTVSLDEENELGAFLFLFIPKICKRSVLYPPDVSSCKLCFTIIIK